jgi:hypothetical protein
MGRKSTFTPELAAEICERIARGEPLRQICRDEHMPAFQRVYEWLAEDNDFAGRFARARDVGFDAIAAEALEIADTPVLGEETEDDGEKVKVKRADMLGHRKLQVWTRLQLLAKWSPRYRENSGIELTGPGGGPVKIDDTQASSRLAALVAAARARKDAQVDDDDADDLDGLV